MLFAIDRDSATAHEHPRSTASNLAPPDALARWMDDQGMARGFPISVERITAGHSCEIFRVERGPLRAALRRPPLAPLSPTAHNMEREHRVLTALSATHPTPPVPRPIALCSDASVIGASFLLMEFVDGVVLRDILPRAFAGDDTIGRQAGLRLIETLAQIHSVDWRARGLEGFGRPERYLTRQVPRWLAQLESYRVRPLPQVDSVADWLRTHEPPAQPPSLIHGDYKLDNVLVDPAPPLRVRAVVDWEQATIGDPLVDLGWMLALWWTRDEEPVGGVSGCLAQAQSVPTRDELAGHYATLTGADLSHVLYYQVLALFKLACVMEGSFSRFVRGTSDDPFFATLEDGVPRYAERALALIG